MAATTAKPKLNRWTKLAFGAGDLGPAIETAIYGFFLNYFLLNVAGLNPARAGTILLIAKSWDAVNDPLIGALTDRTRTRWGRRRPWLLFGAIPFGVAYFLLWLVPALNADGKFWYYLIMAIILDTAYSAVNVPYTALTPELSDDYDERTSLNTYRFGFSILGGIIAAALHNVIVGALGNATGWMVSAGIWSVFMTVPSLITFAFTRESHFSAEDAPKGPGYFEGLKIAFSNKAFVSVTLIFLLSWLSLQFVQNNLKLYVEQWVHAGEYFTFLIVGVQFASFLFMLMWARISQRIGKQRVYYAGMAVWVLISIVLFFVRPGQVILLFALAILAGVGVSVAYLVPWSMLPDVVEMDELETGQRREGIYYGFFVFMQKLGLGLGLAISNYVLELAGYVNPPPGSDVVPEQPESVLLALRIFVSFAPAAILLLSFLAVRAYPITREKHQAMLDELARRRAAQQTA